MRKALKFLHSLASCGVIGALLGYMILLLYAPQGTPTAYADLRQSISLLCDYLLFPSLAVALVTGLLAMAVHHPFQNMRWVWVKALLGLSMFEATLGIIGSKANYAATVAKRIVEGEAAPGALEKALTNEWNSLGIVLALSVANIVLGVWRPPLKSRQRTSTTGSGVPPGRA